MKNHHTLNKYGGLALLILMLGGCAGFSSDRGFTSVQQAAQQRLGKAVEWPRTDAEASKLAERVDELLKAPLDVESAVQVALLNNKSLQASFYGLGISEADLVQAGRLPNPRFSMLYARHNGDYKIEQALTFNVFSLLTMPKARAIEQRRFELTQKVVAQEVFRLARDTRNAYFNAVAANEAMRYMSQVKDAAEAGSELARGMTQKGNWSKLEQAREQGFYADAMLEVTRAKNAQTASRERLLRLLSLSDAQAGFKLAERLPDLPDAPQALPQAEQTAMQQRVDLQIIRADTEVLAKELGLTKATRFINVLELGPARVLEGSRNEPYKNGVDISFELPLFDWGDARVARAEARYMQAVNRAAQAAVDARSEVRQSYASYRANYDVAKHYRDEIIPLRKRISEENQLRYNGMLVSVFELLADARAQVGSVNSYIEALREFWLSESDLQLSMIGGTAPAKGEF